MANILSKLKILIPTRTKPKGSFITPTFEEEKKDDVFGLPAYREHLDDLLSLRRSSNSQELIKSLLKSDPDASASLNAYLTTAGKVLPYIEVTDVDGAVDREAYKLVNEIIEVLETRRDYTKGFVHKRTLAELANDFRYMIIAQGGIGAEAVFGDILELTEIRLVELASIRWQEKEAGKLVPYQDQGGGDPVKLDIPTFFVAWFRKDPSDVYSSSPFISAINTMAARQQVINDLYRIMQITGFPRITLKVLEEVLVKNAPPEIRNDQLKLRQYINARRGEMGAQFAAIRPDQPIIHTDSMEVKMLNDSNPAAGLDISKMIEVLNAQNQAGLRTMATVLGRGESGVNTATVEANLFAMNADSINKPIAEVLSKILTMALRLQGSEGRVKVKFPEINLRSELEGEANITMKNSRLRQDLSDGLITDDEYHLAMYRRIRPDSSPELSGTGFNSKKLEVDATRISPNSDPAGESVSRAADKQAKSN
jgi:hypothetical protein